MIRSMYEKFKISVEKFMNKKKLDALLQSTKDKKDTSLKGLCTYAKCVDVYDGDTCRFKFYYKDEIVQYMVRLSGIDTPELHPRKTKDRTEESIIREKQLAYKSRDELINLICGNKLVYVKFDKFDKYGRPLVTIYENKCSECVSVNDILIEKGLAVPYNGNKKTKEW